MHKGFRFAPLLLLAALLGCGGGTGGGGSSGIPPQITSFGATPNTIQQGRPSCSRGVFRAKTPCRLPTAPGRRSRFQGTSYTVNPAQSTVYRLTATNDFGSNYSDTTVTLAGDTSEPPTPPSPPPPPDDPAPPGNPNPPGNPSPPTPPAPRPRQRHRHHQLRRETLALRHPRHRLSLSCLQSRHSRLTRPQLTKANPQPFLGVFRAQQALAFHQVLVR